MKQFITAFIRNWSPWHLRKRVAKLKRSLDHLSEVREDFISEANRHNVKENERLTKENERLTAALASANTEIVGLASKINNIVFSLRGATNDLDTVSRCMFTLINRHTNNKGDQQ